MRCAADFRAEARAALKGRWGLAIGIGFLAMVLGGIAGVGGLDVNFVMVEGNFQMTLDIFGQRLNPVEMSVWAVLFWYGNIFLWLLLWLRLYD